jgi:hypothetical protein
MQLSWHRFLRHQSEREWAPSLVISRGKQGAHTNSEDALHTKYSTSSTVNTDYGPSSQQPDVDSDEL